METEFATAAENLAFDEALIESADAWSGSGPAPIETLRLWEMKEPVVVLGRGSNLSEVFADRCRRDGVSVLRRCSGGASIVAGPGCLMYSLLLSLETNPILRDLAQAHRFVMEKVLAAVRMVEPAAYLDGTCDVVIAGKKCSGNAVRYKRNWMLYHGTLLYDFPIDCISEYLAMPPRQPNYRAGRTHGDFLTNISDRSRSICTADGTAANDPLNPFSAVLGKRLRFALTDRWSAAVSSVHPCLSAIEDHQRRLLKAKYS